MSRRRLNYKQYRQFNNPSHESGDGIGSIIGYAALAIGAYLLYDWWTTPVTAATTATPVTAATTATVVSTVPTTSSPNITTPTVVIPQSSSTVQVNTDPTVQALTLVQLLEQTANVVADTPMTADQWSYYYQQLRGITINSDQYSTIINNLNNQFPGNGITGSSVMTATEFAQGLTSVGLTGLGNTATTRLNPSMSNQASVQNAPYGSSHPGRPFKESHPAMTPSGRGLGIIGQGYGINKTIYGNATKYELATKYLM